MENLASISTISWSHTIVYLSAQRNGHWGWFFIKLTWQSRSWLEYRRDSNTAKIPSKKQLDLMHFKIELAYQLISYSTVSPAKRGRPRSSSLSPFASPTSSPPPLPQIPGSWKKSRFKKINPDIDTNVNGHYPSYDNEKEATRCKIQTCNAKTHMTCEKCNIHLCLTKERNCFKVYHS